MLSANTDLFSQTLLRITFLFPVIGNGKAQISHALLITEFFFQRAHLIGIVYSSTLAQKIMSDLSLDVFKISKYISKTIIAIRRITNTIANQKL